MESVTALLTLALVLATTAAVLIGLISLHARRFGAMEQARPRGTRNAQPAWRAVPRDQLGTLRSPYKPEPLCVRCVAVRLRGKARYLCRMNERCGLVEDEKVS